MSTVLRLLSITTASKSSILTGPLHPDVGQDLDGVDDQHFQDVLAQLVLHFGLVLGVVGPSRLLRVKLTDQNLVNPVATFLGPPGV